MDFVLDYLLDFQLVCLFTSIAWFINNKWHPDARHEKTDLKVFVVVIPKKGWARMAWARMTDFSEFESADTIGYILEKSVSCHLVWQWQRPYGLFSRDACHPWLTKCLQFKWNPDLFQIKSDRLLCEAYHRHTETTLTQCTTLSKLVLEFWLFPLRMEIPFWSSCGKFCILR